MKRRERGRRVKTRPVLLTARDLDVLTLVGLCRYVSTEQLARELFPSLDRAQKRLRQLLDGGFARVTLLAPTECNLVSLSPAGLSVLAERRPGVASRARLAGAINLRGVEHHLAVVDTRLYLAALAVAEGGQLVRFGTGGSRTAQDLGLDGFHLVPDAVAEMDLGGDRIRIAVEIDCGSEDSQDLLPKLNRYAQVVEHGLVAEVWIVMNGGEVRQRNVEELAVSAGVGESTRVMVRDHLLIRPVQRPGKRAGGASDHESERASA